MYCDAVCYVVYMKDFAPLFDAMNSIIHKTETTLVKTLHTAPAQFMDLSWKRSKHGKFRIHLGDTPLMETKSESRIRTISQIDGLVNACDDAMDSALNTIKEMADELPNSSE